jgi:tRNA-binding EMAP/Myf-like protein
MNPAPIKPLISTSDLDNIDVRGGTILAVEDVAHSEKLVRLRVDFGDHARSILVGMKKWRPWRCGSYPGSKIPKASTASQKLWFDRA